jgi:hypothetical protein
VHSKNAEFMTAIARIAGAMKLIYGIPPISFTYVPMPIPIANRYRNASTNGGKKFTFHVLKKTTRFRCQTFQALFEIRGRDKNGCMITP